MPPITAAGALKNDGSGIVTWEDTITHAAEWNNKAMPGNAHGMLHNDGAGNLGWELPVATAFGSWDATKTIDTVYQAATDGFVCVYILNSVYTRVDLKTDSSATPATIRTCGAADQAAASLYDGICCPVKKNEYWNAARTVGSGTCTVYWIPVA